MFKLIESKTPKKQEYFKKWQGFVKKHGYIISEDVFRSRTHFDKYPRYLELSEIPYELRSKSENSEYYKVRGALERFAQNNRIQNRWFCLNPLNCWNAVTPISSQFNQE